MSRRTLQGAAFFVFGVDAIGDKCEHEKPLRGHQFIG
jgi:hypothetical protein